MRKFGLYMHVTLDGFTARTNGEMNWITVNNNIFDFIGSRTQQADTALYGRGTYEIMQAYWPTAADQPGASKHDIEHGNWYNNVEKVVVSESLPDNGQPNTTVIGNDIVDKINELKQQQGGEIMMIGSPTLAAFLMSENVIDDYWLFVNPVILGQGQQLFKDIKNEIRLKLVDSTAFDGGVVCLHYQKV